jgi:hypothetical protein
MRQTGPPGTARRASVPNRVMTSPKRDGTALGVTRPGDDVARLNAAACARPLVRFTPAMTPADPVEQYGGRRVARAVRPPEAPEISASNRDG